MNDWQVGRSAEDSFKEAALLKGVLCEASSKDENMFSHIDFHITTRKSVDVKAMKRQEKSGDVQWEWTWVEFQNVRGSKGWLLGGADLIAFEVVDAFWIINREALLKYCRKTIHNEYVDRAIDAKYRLYKRRGRDDVISMIHLPHLMDNLISREKTVWNK